MENKAEMGMICGNRAEDMKDATYGSGSAGGASIERDSFRDICDDAQSLHDGLMQDQKLGGAATLDELINVLQISGRLAGLLCATQSQDNLARQICEALAKTKSNNNWMEIVSKLLASTGDTPQPQEADDRAENTTDNPRSWIAWKRRAEIAEKRIIELKKLLATPDAREGQEK